MDVNFWIVLAGVLWTIIQFGGGLFIKSLINKVQKLIDQMSEVSVNLTAIIERLKAGEKHFDDLEKKISELEKENAEIKKNIEHNNSEIIKIKMLHEYKKCGV